MNVPQIEAMTTREPSGWELAAESITVKIRWFGVVVGYLLVNLLDRPAGSHRPEMNAILTLGAMYAAWSTPGGACGEKCF